MKSAGFTLIELLVTISIASILMLVAIPNFTAFQRNSELTAAVNGLMSGISVARSEALKRGSSTIVAPIDGANWTSGYKVVVDTNNDGAVTAADLQITQTSAVPSYITVTANSTLVRFNGSGYSVAALGGFSNATISFARSDVTGSEVFNQTRLLKIFAPGRVRVCTPKNAADTECSVASEE